VSAPVTYIPEFLRDHQTGEYFDTLWNDLPWEQRDGAPRRECWLNPYNLDYTYGTGEYARTYKSHHPYLVNTAIEYPAIDLVGYFINYLNANLDLEFDCCFVNGYAHGKEHLGWHADDSPEMDHEHPIAVVSFGAEREIWLRQKSVWKEAVNRLAFGKDSFYPPEDPVILGNGSLLLMHAGMQKNWQHRIPKSSVHNCGPRVSLTFRKLVR